MYCRFCGKEIEKGVSICTECNKSLAKEVKKVEKSVNDGPFYQANMYTNPNKSVFCNSCHTLILKGSKYCQKCGAKAPAQKDYFFLSLCGVVLFIILCGVGFYFRPVDVTPVPSVDNSSETDIVSQISEFESSDEVSAVSSVPVSDMSEEEYKANCTTCPYNDMIMNFQVYGGRMITFTGQVCQVSESNGVLSLRVNTTENTVGAWSDPIDVDYVIKSDEDKSIGVNSIITVYGEVYVNENPVEAALEVVTAYGIVPKVNAQYIDRG